MVLDDVGQLDVTDRVLGGLNALGDRLARYNQVLRGRPLRVLLVADDRLRYEEAARVIGICSTAGVSALRLAASAGPGP